MTENLFLFYLNLTTNIAAIFIGIRIIKNLIGERYSSTIFEALRDHIEEITENRILRREYINGQDDQENIVLDNAEEEEEEEIRAQNQIEVIFIKTIFFINKFSRGKILLFQLKIIKFRELSILQNAFQILFVDSSFHYVFF